MNKNQCLRSQSHLQQKVVEGEQLVVRAALVVNGGGDQEDLWVRQAHGHGSVRHVLGAHGPVDDLTVTPAAARNLLELDIPGEKIKINK